MAALAIVLSLAGCAAARSGADARAATADAKLTSAETAFLDSLEKKTFEWFWDLSDSTTGLTPDRWPTKSFCSVGAVGFALTAYPIGAERGWVTRAQAAERVRRTLEFFWSAPQDTARTGVTGYRGFFYHFLDMRTGHRFETVELSTMDTGLLLGGMLFCQSWFDRADPREARIRALADSIYRRVDFTWSCVRPPLMTLGWSPEEGFLPYDWRGYNETMLLHILALGSTTHPVDAALWPAWTKGYRFGTFQGQEYLGFAPLFGHQYSHCWIDYRGIRDAWMKEKGLDYFENSRRATLAQRAYAIANPSGFRGYGERLWGLSACDGPLDGRMTLDGRDREFRTYCARGACFTEVTDDGTIAPTAAGGSIAFAPKECVSVLLAMRETYGENIYGRYGFFDALNPTLDAEGAANYGGVVPGKGWFDTDYLGIDQGPFIIMIENQRSELVWKTLRRNPTFVRGLRRAGFSGGWLDRAPATP